MRSSRWADSPSELKEEAAYTIPGECERLFCDNMATIFLGEGSFVRPESFGMDALDVRPDEAKKERTCIQRWVEVLDYTSDAVYRGFVGSVGEEQTLFVFFEEGIPGYNLKTGLMALFELANLSDFGCTRIVACISRSQDSTEHEVIRNLGWCGFSLTTLQPWCSKNHREPVISAKWLFLSAEV
ncbi:ornithine decarboxylase antizyme [Aspergillus campestris IBT 28561]|uniref:Ornithine decarboxylase antizyme n=1 Tax=Aspergillus campestris (strain IBT 28561) TaxID=1392248 RepID=A0A2I1CZ54_ASPC2|nr:ornithine decarboxylase antizyme [Aspergillus campestris IBT 28561]PKY02904.1 ornithine decarboxylase antizyme [Aspergillus campestris IBT 28561]